MASSWSPLQILLSRLQNALNSSTATSMAFHRRRSLQAPVNPADINQIQGKYGAKPDLPAVPGNEGVGVVKSAANQVRSDEHML